MSKTVVVTGAGRGLGLSIVEELLDAGYHVIGVSRTHTDEVKADRVRRVLVLSHTTLLISTGFISFPKTFLRWPKTVLRTRFSG